MDLREVDAGLLEHGAGQDPGAAAAAARPLPEVLPEPLPVGGLDLPRDPVLQAAQEAGRARAEGVRSAHDPCFHGWMKPWARRFSRSRLAGPFRFRRAFEKMMSPGVTMPLQARSRESPEKWREAATTVEQV